MDYVLPADPEAPSHAYRHRITRLERGRPAPDIDQDEAIGRADAIALLDEVFEHMFPGLNASL